jgi:hypothetical protein
LLLLNGASTHGPLAAFRLVPRRLHFVVDVVLIVLMAVAGVAGGSAVEATGRSILIGLAVVHAFVTWRTSYATKPPRRLEVPDSEGIGRIAGHVTGKAYNEIRARTRGRNLKP